MRIIIYLVSKDLFSYKWSSQHHRILERILGRHIHGLYDIDYCIISNIVHFGSRSRKNASPHNCYNSQPENSKWGSIPTNSLILNKLYHYFFFYTVVDFNITTIEFEASSDYLWIIPIWWDFTVLGEIRKLNAYIV